jgi:hypothetical protein
MDALVMTLLFTAFLWHFIWINFQGWVGQEIRTHQRRELVSRGTLRCGDVSGGLV